MERDCPAPICRQYHRPGWVRRAEGNSPDGAIRLRAESAAAEFGLRTPPAPPSPYFAANPALYSVLGGGTPTSDTPGATVSGTKSNGTMRYNSLQAVLQKQMSHGLQYQVAYTFSKCMSDSTGYYGAWNNALSASAYWQNVYDQRSEYAPCYYDATHVLSAYAIYDLPFGRGKMLGKNVNRVVNEVIGGWEVSPIVSFRTGWPMPP